jgi:hypothetical protein
MSFAAHGNWCGPGWSARQWKDAKDLTEEDKQVEAIDELDQACKEHDIGIAEGDPLANQKFYRNAAEAGWYGLTLAQFVKIGGPSLQNYLRGGEAMVKGAGVEKNYKRRDVKNKPRKSVERYSEKMNEYAERKEMDAEDSDSERLRQNDRDDRVVEALVDINGDTPMMAPGGDPNLTAGKDASQSSSQFNSSARRTINFDSPNMDGDAGEPMEMAMMSASNSDGNKSTNTKIKPNYSLPREIGFLTETRTAMLPLTIYFSVNGLDQDSPVVFKFMLNDTFDIFRNTDVVAQTFTTGNSVLLSEQVNVPNFTPAVAPGGNPYQTTLISKSRVAGDPRTKGISNDMAYSVYEPHGNKLIKPVNANMFEAKKFPITTRTSVSATTTTTGSGKFGYNRKYSRRDNGDYAMAWRDYYESVYRNRHVFQCDWKLEVECAQEGAYHRGVVLDAVETVTTQSVATPVIPTNKSLGETTGYKRIKEHRLYGYNVQGGKEKTIISSSWNINRPARHDVVDDENTKVWYPTQLPNGLPPFDWQEYQTLLFYNDQFSSNTKPCFNCKLDLLYHVQYRDLIGTLRYPDSDSATQLLQIRDTMYPRGHPTPWVNFDIPDRAESLLYLHANYQ